MKKLLLKLLSTICVFVLSLNVFIACSENVPNSNNSGDNSETNQEDGENENKYANYSSILKKVLTDRFYTSKETSLLYPIGSQPSEKQLPYFDTIPVGFLLDQGYSLDQIYSISTRSCAYKMDNEKALYIMCQIANTSNDYYTNYELKYNLTDQEIAELEFLFSKMNTQFNINHKIYCQAGQWVQEVSFQKIPTLLWTSYQSIDFNTKNNTSRKLIAYVEQGNWISPDTNATWPTHTIKLYPPTFNEYSPRTKIKSEIQTITYIDGFSEIKETIIDGKIVYNGKFNSQLKPRLETITENATCYQTITSDKELKFVSILMEEYPPII